MKLQPFHFCFKGPNNGLALLKIKYYEMVPPFLAPSDKNNYLHIFKIFFIFVFYEATGHKQHKICTDTKLYNYAHHTGPCFDFSHAWRHFLKSCTGSFYKMHNFAAGTNG